MSDSSGRVGRQQQGRQRYKKKGAFQKVAIFRETIAAAAAPASNESTTTTTTNNATTAEDTKTSSTHEPLRVRVNKEAVSRPIHSFRELLEREPSLVTDSGATDAFVMADYLMQSIKMLETGVRNLIDSHKLHAQGFRDEPLLADEDRRRLIELRNVWLEHMRAHKYTLWSPPPLSGGRTATYSLAAQLWLAVLFADAILQLANLVPDLFEFDAISSVYLSKNRLLIDTSRVMRYSLRAVSMATELFVSRLDVLTGYSRDYLLYAKSLEHCIARHVCLGTTDGANLNVPEWCEVMPGARNASTKRVTEAFLRKTMVWFATLYDYEENYAFVGDRMPAAEVASQRWFPGAASLRGQTAFLCGHSHDNMKDEVFTSAQRDMAKDLFHHPSDVDFYRLDKGNNLANNRDTRIHRFDHTSVVAQAYRYFVYFDRTIYENVEEAIQWREGSEKDTRSAALGHSQRINELSVLFVWFQFLGGPIGVDFRRKCLLFHRDPAFATSLQRARSCSYPLIISQFGQFVVLVPTHVFRAAVRDDGEGGVAVGRGAQRHRRRGGGGGGDVGVDETIIEQRFECPDMFIAIAVWSVWTMYMTGGELLGRHIGTFLYAVYGQQQLDRRVRAVRTFLCL